MTAGDTDDAIGDGPGVALDEREGRPFGFALGRVLVARSTVEELIRQVDPEEMGYAVRQPEGTSFVIVEPDEQSMAELDADAMREWTLSARDTLTQAGLPVQLDHAFRADQHFGANPFTANPFTANPFTANPFTANPFTANPFTANPFTANRLDPNRWPRTQSERAALPRNSARPATRGWRSLSPPSPAPEGAQPPAGPPRVLVLDTGLPPVEAVPAESASWLASLHAASEPVANAAAGASPATNDTAAYWRFDRRDSNNDDRLDPVAGHGIFIASIIERIAPGSATVVMRVLRRTGYGYESEIAAALEQAAAATPAFDIVNLSFSAYEAPDESYAVVAGAVEAVQESGAVVVASAGNEAVWEAPLPASLPGVISVAALDEHEMGPAWFTNYGPWVTACAPGSDIEGDFWWWEGGERIWRGRAVWSGTSFAAPYVVGVIARMMQRYGFDAVDAARALLTDQERGYIPWHGTVVRGF